MSGIFQGIRALPQGALTTTRGLFRALEGATLLASSGFKYAQPIIEKVEKIAGGGSPKKRSPKRSQKRSPKKASPKKRSLRRSSRLSKKKRIDYSHMGSPNKRM
jgi:hypothetical protein